MNSFFPKSKYYLDVILSALIFGLNAFGIVPSGLHRLMVYSFPVFSLASLPLDKI